ncbi:hypothetical protein [Funiculus sociatus]|uniref:hypothetical protein n=1 Tax=Funiculus sociatus TaxID=450527 RepID=UPI003D65E1F0
MQLWLRCRLLNKNLAALTTNNQRTTYDNLTTCRDRVWVENFPSVWLYSLPSDAPSLRDSRIFLRNFHHLHESKTPYFPCLPVSRYDQTFDRIRKDLFKVFLSDLVRVPDANSHPTKSIRTVDLQDSARDA